MSERLEEIKDHYVPYDENFGLDSNDLEWLIEQAELVQELENRNKELEYASKYNGELNEFLQKRKLPPSTLGRHVVDVVMDYVEELEEDIKRYRKHVHEARNDVTSQSELLGKETEQNKRYREKFEAIQDIQQWHRKQPDYEVLNIVNEALESDST